MFEGITWAMVGNVALWVVVGLLLRTFVPYLVAAYELVKETNRWVLPAFEPKYVLPPAATLGLYALGALTIPGTLNALAGMHPALLVAAVYSGQDIVRQAIKVVRS